MRTAVILSHAKQVQQQPILAGHLPHILLELGYTPRIRSFVVDQKPDKDVDLLLVMGSFDSTLDTSLPWLADERTFVDELIARDVPVIGICFGAQLLAEQLGGSVENAPAPENGFFSFDLTATAPALNLDAGPWAEFHYQRFSLPAGATLLASTPIAPQAFVHGHTLGLQFHLELTAAAAEVLLTEHPEMLTGEARTQFLHRLRTHQDDFRRRAHAVIAGFLGAA